MRHRLLVLGVSTIALAAACGDNGGSTPAIDARPAIDSVHVTHPDARPPIDAHPPDAFLPDVLHADGPPPPPIDAAPPQIDAFTPDGPPSCPFPGGNSALCTGLTQDTVV